MPDQPVRVGFVMHVMQVAGAEVLVTQIIDRLKSIIEPTIFCLDAMGELGERMVASGVPVVVLDRQPGIDGRLAFRFAKEIRSRRIDVLHAHQYTPFFYSALARFIGSWRTKILFTEHGRHYPDHVTWKRKLSNRLFFSRICSTSTACCRFSALALERNEGFSDVQTIPNGVDLQRIHPRGTFDQQSELRQRLGLSDDRLYVACVARFHPIKDHVTLLRAWTFVQAQVPQARLILVGEGPERPAIENLAHTLKVSESVDFWGLRHDVADILRAVDVFALTSLSEASSLTLMEAMASECPVVITDVGGNGEHVNHGVEGMLAPRSDDAALGTYLCQLLMNEELRHRLGVSARVRVQAQFDLFHAVDRYKELYLRLGKPGKQ